MTTRIITGDCRAVLATLPAESVHCVVTSPPYWGLRDYGIPPSIWGGDPACEHAWGERKPLNNKSGLHRMPPNQTGGNKDYSTIAQHRGVFCQYCGAWSGAHGLEPTFDLYVRNAVEVFREVRRVLRPDGTLWLNLGDAYFAGHGGSTTEGDYIPKVNRDRAAKPRARSELENSPAGWAERDVTPKRITAGCKPKDLMGMPWRVAFALQADGWWLRQDIIWSKPNPMPESVTDRCTKAHEYIFMLSKSARYFYDNEAIKEPAEMKPQNRFTEREDHPKGDIGRPGHRRPPGGTGRATKRNRRSVWEVATHPFSEAHFATFPPALIEPCIMAGCPEGGTVLDPFGGAGTTGLVADRLQRNAILIELNPDYAAMAERRIHDDAPLFAQLAEAAE